MGAAWSQGPSAAGQLPARATSGTSEQKSIEILQSREAAGSDTDGHNVKLSLKPSTNAQRPTSHTLEISAVQRLLGRTRRQGTLSVTSTEAAVLWARHWERIPGARRKEDQVCSSALVLNPNAASTKKYITTPLGKKCCRMPKKFTANYTTPIIPFIILNHGGLRTRNSLKLPAVVRAGEKYSAPIWNQRQLLPPHCNSMKTHFHVYKPFTVPSINLTIQLPAKKWKKIQKYIRNWQLTQLCAVVNRCKQQPCVLEVLYIHRPAACARNAPARTEGGPEKFVTHL